MQNRFRCDVSWIHRGLSYNSRSYDRDRLLRRLPTNRGKAFALFSFLPNKVNTEVVRRDPSCLIRDIHL